MCLVTKWIEGKISDNPVKCYKVYQKSEDGGMVSYFQKEKYGLKEGDKVVARGYENITREHVCGYYEMRGGFIHAFCREYMIFLLGYEQSKLAERIFEIIETDMESDAELDNDVDGLLKMLDDLCWCEMEIPAGERYWSGICGDVCAKRMVFKKEIKLKKSEILRLLSEELMLIREWNVREIIRMYEGKGE